ncbi:MAG: hypothetical protein EPN49_08500 [Rhodanobacter sp.]|nr:MAG: hypothetical protein EPN49_08500 [Rhodanobacter sp.]
MTIAATVVSNAGAASAARTTAAADAHAADAPDQFDRQLDLARQQHAGTTDAGDPSKTPSHLAPQSSDPRQRRDRSPPAMDATSAAAAQAAVATPPKAAAIPKAAENSNHAGDHAGDAAATAMAGAMLALLGPSLAVALRPGAVAATMASGIAAAGNGGKGVAADANAGAVGLPQAIDAGSGTAAATSALPLGASVALAAQGLTSTKAEPASDSTSALAQAVALPAPPAGGAPADMPLLQLSAPVGSPAFAQELGQHVAWLGGQDVTQARIRLHPAELGQLDVKINVTHGRVDVVFSAQHPAAVNAVQQSLPQLEHMLAQHGLALGHAEVGQHDHGGHRSHGGNVPAAALTGDPDEVGGVSLPVSPGSVSLLDAFA